jgi:glycosyltransferase involved in cell wall biosynthesis
VSVNEPAVGRSRLGYRTVIVLRNFDDINCGSVAIGRNEGERLRQCLKSLSATKVVYVDSGSTDGSAQWARDHGAVVIDLDMSLPFTAARARNVGFRELRKLIRQLRYVQFVDGDCELIDGWFDRAVSFLDSHPDVAAVFGRRRERYPERSIYNWLSDQEWDGSAGGVGWFGGDVLIRTDAFESVGGYRDDLIAGEEPEFCVRLRAAGWRIWRLDSEMTLHDVAMTHFGQWWRRTLRTGYSFAQGAYLHGAAPERHRVWESRRAWLWGVLVPFVCLLIGVLYEPWGWAVWLVYPVQIIRQTIRNPGPLGDRAVRALFQVLARFPEAWGQIKFTADRLLGRQTRLIEYK